MKAETLSRSLKRKFYVFGVLLGTVTMLITWAFKAGQSPFILYGYPVLIAATLGIGWLAWTRSHLIERLEGGLFFAISGFFLGKIGFLMLFAQDRQQAWVEVQAGYWALLFAYLFAFLAFSAPKALWLSLTVNAAAFAINLAILLPSVARGGAADELIEAGRFGVRTLTLILLLYLLAQYKAALSDERRRGVELFAEARTDPLTDLPNRRALEERLRERVAQGRPFTVLMIDVDHFKGFNDRYGHAAGDAILRHVGQRLRRTLREGDLVGRWGGEEFAVVSGEGSLAQAKLLAERLRQHVSERPIDGQYAVTASFGVAVYEPGESLEELLERADTSLYQAKHGGRNMVVG
ncbi:sensor domain-containing diguanylate cyclase [Calidithermus chliarophilus]|uniref:GGDEF domain-containing protein n=1 Tax=Calidithermus chliarophilus TaxID=52023 RepID=UPI00040298BB|nr:GGDEF domain-containing protein [Calidithermus chliarophilus]